MKKKKLKAKLAKTEKKLVTAKSKLDKLRLAIKPKAAADAQKAPVNTAKENGTKPAVAPKATIRANTKS